MKNKVALLTMAISSVLVLTACNDDDNTEITIPTTNGNHAPTLTVSAKTVAKEAAVEGVVIVESRGEDKDSDTLTYSLAGNDTGYYAIDSATGAVSLTTKGAEAVAADKVLPEIKVKVSDGKDEVEKSATPKIGEGSTSDAPKLTALLANDDRFSTLASALQATAGDSTNNLGTDIEQLNDITLLAPTNEAIDKTLDILTIQMPELDTNNSGKIELNELTAKPELLKSILQYHVLTSKVEAAQVASSLNKNLPTVNGLPLFVTQSGTDFIIPSQAIQLANINKAAGAADTAQAKVDLTSTDIAINNGVVHVIDQALIPPMYDIDETLTRLSETKQFRSFLDIVSTANGSVAGASSDKDATSYTVLAPNNAALNQKCIDLNPAAKGQTGGKDIIDANNECFLEPVAGYGSEVNKFVPVSGNIKSDTMFSAELPEIKGDIVLANIIASNGVIHITDSLQ